jgi:hypothetical protein
MRKLSVHLLSVFFIMAMFWFSARAQSPTAAGIVRLDPGADQIFAADAKLELLQGEGAFEGGEGPLWIQRGESGYLLFSDVGGNRIFQWTPSCFKFPCGPDGKLSVFSEHSGYADESRVGSIDASGAHLYGTNGLTLDRDGRIVMDANGDRAVERLEKDGKRSTSRMEWLVVYRRGRMIPRGNFLSMECTPFGMATCNCWTRIQGIFLRTAWHFPRTKKFYMSITEDQARIKGKSSLTTSNRMVRSKIAASLLILPARKGLAAPMA